jgi:NADH-quinone oxidoreductase subunit H
MGEYVKMFSMSAVFSTLFLGGFAGPGLGRTYELFGWFVIDTNWLGPVYLMIKIFFCLGVMIWVRATLPRFRYDRLMKFGWTRMLPFALINVLITALFITIFKL